MKLTRIFGAIFALILIHLTLFVSCSTIQRSLSDDIRSGISIAGKILVVDSPTNIAVISNIAELVSRAFTQNNNNQPPQQNPQNGWDRRQLTARPSEHLEDFGDIPQNNQNQHGIGSSEQGIDDNVIVGGNVFPGPTTTTNGLEHGFLGQVLRVLGMDSSKIGALAINGIIFIAQMIGRSFLSAFTTMANKVGTTPKPPSNVNERSRRLSDESTKSTSIWDNALDWIVQQSKSNPFLSQHIEAMLDKDLPDRIVQMVDNDIDDDEKSSSENTDCIKQLLCKTTPFIWSMQKAVSAKINESDGEANEADDATNSNGKNASADDDNRLKEFSRYLPTFDESTSYGSTCENNYFRHQFRSYAR